MKFSFKNVDIVADLNARGFHLCKLRGAGSGIGQKFRFIGQPFGLLVFFMREGGTGLRQLFMCYSK